MRRVMILVILLFSLAVFSEYRVFTLKITNTKQNLTRTMKSTLDPEQYQSFYPLNPDESITYINTWRCRGSTRDFLAYCEPPLKAPNPSENTSQ